MSPLRQRMLEDMQLRGLSARTQEAYSRAVWKLAQHYHRSPAQLSDEELRRYFLHLTNDKKLARLTTTIALCGIKFFYEQTLKQSWPTLRFVRPQSEHKLPVVLSRAEVRRIHTKTPPLALASGTPALVTTLFVLAICEDLKLCPALNTLRRFLKTIVRSLPCSAQLTQTSGAHRSFLLA